MGPDPMGGDPMMGSGPMMGPDPMGGDPMMGPDPMGGDPMMGSGPMMGPDPMGGDPMMGSGPMMGPDPMGGDPMMGSGPMMGPDPMGGDPMMGSGPMMGPDPMGGDPMMGSGPMMGPDPMGGDPMMGSGPMMGPDPMSGDPMMGSDPYAGPEGPDPYGPDPYAPDPYAPDPYGPVAYGPDPNAPDPYAGDPYAGDPYGPDPYGPDPYAPPPEDYVPPPEDSTPGNQPPQAQDDAAQTAQNQPVTIPVSQLLGNDTDANGDTLTLTAVANPTNGTVVLQGNNVVFTPATDFVGAAEFAYQVSDGNGGVHGARVNVTVGSGDQQPPPNQQPVTQDDSAQTTQNQPATIPVSQLLGNDSDADGDPLTLTGVSNPVNGTVQLQGDNVVFTPDANFVGTAGFTYQASDGNGGTDSGLVNVTVGSASPSPIQGTASDDFLTGTAENDTLIGLGGNDMLNGDAGTDRYVFEQNGIGNGVDMIQQSGFTPGAGGDILDFLTQGQTVTSVTGNVLSASSTGELAGLTDQGVIVLKQNAVGDGNALKSLLDLTLLDDMTGNHIVVWEMDPTNVGVGIVNNTAPDGDDVSVNQVATITGFTDQTEVDSFTESLTADNFDIV